MAVAVIKDSTLKPNGDINKFSIGLGYSGFGVKEKIDYSKYIGTSKTNQNDNE